MFTKNNVIIISGSAKQHKRFKHGERGKRKPNCHMGA
jgi:hypothetical protein